MLGAITVRKKESYTSLSLIKQCPYEYKLHYVDGIYKKQDSISLRVGNLCHKILELQRNPQGKHYTTEELLEILENGYEDGREQIVGLKFIQDNYFEDYYTVNSKSGLNYKQKLEIFEKCVSEYIPDKEWETIAVELPFEITYKDFILSGKIDRLDINKAGDYKVTDYKTANVVYQPKELKTPLQMYIYALAVQKMYKKFPTNFEYDFIVLGEKRAAMEPGWETRGEKLLDKLVEDRSAYYMSEEFPPKPSPLCYWCPYYKQECEYYSLWTPENKTFFVNKKYESGQTNTPTKKEFIW